MKDKLHPHRFGLVLGTVLGFGHAAWSLLVALGWAKPLFDWVLSLHFVTLTYSLEPFSLTNAIMLVAFTTVWGYVVGYVFAFVWNWVSKR